MPKRWTNSWISEKLRNVSLKKIIGQERAVGALLGILSNGKLASSYLFCGESGIGKKTAAISFAKALNCLGVSPESGHISEDSQIDACDMCDSCVKIDAGVHPDFLLVSPDERQIRIEEIRRVEESLSFKAFEGRMKVIVIDDAESMNLPAANAFLKTLEEPPEGSILILVSSMPDLLPATITSRCSRINFTPLPIEACRKVLEGRVEERDLEILTRLSMGRPGIVLSSDLLEQRRWFLRLFKGMLAAEKDGWASREEIEEWFDHLVVLLRDLAVLKIVGDRSKLINMDLADFLAELGKSADLKGIIKMQKELNSLRELLIFNLNKSITWNYTASLLRESLQSAK